jgi:hypothetical protein
MGKGTNQKPNAEGTEEEKREGEKREGEKRQFLPWMRAPCQMAAGLAFLFFSLRPLC